VVIRTAGGRYRHHAFVGDSFYSRIMEQLLELRAIRRSAAAVIIEQGLMPNTSRRAEERACGRPNCEGESARMRTGASYPMEIGLQTSRIRGSCGVEPLWPQGSAEVFGVVDAAVEDRHNWRSLAQGLALLQRFRGSRAYDGEPAGPSIQVPAPSGPR